MRVNLFFNKENLKNAIDMVVHKEVKSVSVIKSFDATSSVKINVKYEIIDPDKVPREYCEPSAGKIWDKVRSLNTEEKIKDETKATIRCIPLDSHEEEGKCVFSGKPSKRRVVFARSY